MDDDAAVSQQISLVLQELRHRPELFNEKLFPLLYDVMRRMAQRQLRFDGSGRTLRPTVLVHEAYIRLVRAEPDWQNKAHFLGCASNVMRQILVDYARKRTSLKRGGAFVRVPIDDYAAPAAPSFEHILAVDAALDKLAAFDPMKAELLKLKFFGGLTMQEIAKVLGVGLSTAKEHLRSAQAWMHREIAGTADK
jgi:RNA polymerase sigma factor (TIGR02999 family)